MQIILVPIGLCNKIEQLVRHFLWGGSKEQRQYSLVGWSMVTKPKADGGLGIFQLHHMNLTFNPENDSLTKKFRILKSIKLAQPSKVRLELIITLKHHEYQNNHVFNAL